VLASVFLGALNGPHGYFVDEHDNILGARAITEGQVIYKDYFSHHMPLQYFTTAPLYAITGNHLIDLKLLFGLSMAVWVLVMSRHIYRAFGFKAWAIFSLLSTASTSLSLANMVLAETFVALAATHLFILFATRQQLPFNFRLGLTYGLLAAIPVLSSAAYVGISLIGYTLAIMHGRSWLFTQTQWLARTMATGALWAVPYILLLGYLVTNGAVSSFVAQAFTFNVDYYSQFIAEVSQQGPLATIASQLSIVFGSIHSTIFDVTPENILAFGLLVTIVALLFFALKTKGLRLMAVAAMALLLAGAVRNGFSAAFVGLDLGAAARAGTIVASVGLAIVIVIYFSIQQSKRIASYIKGSLAALVGIFLFSLSLTAATLVTASARDYTQGAGMIARSQALDSSVNIINLVNTNPGDHYWMGPVDFYAQLFIQSQNASSYRFYLPWHAACPECTDELLQDLADQHARVVYWEKDLDIWGIKAEEYGSALQAYLHQNYYQASDERLKNFYFSLKDRNSINGILLGAGYAL